ncbi:MAG TPA: Fe2+-dependent dioxygenase [Dehalococcoidia bacterium]|jgi:PKHD-type hydroxylase
MILVVPNLLSEGDVAALRESIAHTAFVAGEDGAGWSARLVKSNLQAADSPEVEAARALVHSRLLQHPVFTLATRPKTLIGPLISRYQPGHEYGQHVDNPMIGGVRTDVSFTLFLSDPTGYDGGELIIDTPSGEEAFKLEAGSVVTYPATTLHRVAPVTRGERLAAAGWVRSHLRDPAQRELLFDLDTARRRLFEREGKTVDADLLDKCAANLMRMWCED